MEAAERETIISWNDAEGTVNVFTCHRRIMTRMEKLGAKVKGKCIMNGGVRHVEYEIPKDKIIVGLNAKRSITIDQKKHLERARGLLPVGGKIPSRNATVATK